MCIREHARIAVSLKPFHRDHCSGSAFSWSCFQLLKLPDFLKTLSGLFQDSLKAWTAESPPRSACSGCATRAIGTWWSAANASASSTPTRRSAAHRHRPAPRRAPAQGRVRTRPRGAPVLLLRGTRRQALEAATPIYEAARERAIDAYVSAYANPSPELYRDVAGYDRELVLKMALAERERCPE